jgi:hypothetical protein
MNAKNLKKNKKFKGTWNGDSRAGSMTQVVEHQPGKHKAPNSTSSATKKEKKEDNFWNGDSRGLFHLLEPRSFTPLLEFKYWLKHNFYCQPPPLSLNSVWQWYGLQKRTETVFRKLWFPSLSDSNRSTSSTFSHLRAPWTWLLLFLSVFFDHSLW